MVMKYNFTSLITSRCFCFRCILLSSLININIINQFLCLISLHFISILLFDDITFKTLDVLPIFIFVWTQGKNKMDLQAVGIELSFEVNQGERWNIHILIADQVGFCLNMAHPVRYCNLQYSTVLVLKPSRNLARVKLVNESVSINMVFIW